MPVSAVKQFLDREKVKYVTITHSVAYTAQEIAASAAVSGKALAKTVIVKLDGKMAMTVLPASRQIEFPRLAKAAKAKKAVLATEQEFKGRFPNCEIGTMPPFGNLYEMPVYVDRSLTEDKDIAFNAGSHTELIRLTYKSYEKLVKPTVLEFTAKP